MPLSFLNPTLLFGTAAAALPIIIHFLSRRRVRRLPFSDLRFLDEVQSRQARSLGIRRWLLLLLRVLAILLVALAAAGPRYGGVGAASGDRSVLFVIDTSASMGTQMDEGTRLEAALAACEEMIRALPSGAAVQVVTAGGRTAPLFGDWLPAGAGAVGGLSLVQPTDGPWDLAAVLREAARVVARAPGTPVEIVVLSDLQETGRDLKWEPAAEKLNNAGATRFLVYRVGHEAPGGGILAVDLPDRAVRPGENITLGARVLPEFDEQVFSLEIDGRPVAEAVTRGSGAGPVAVEFPVTVPGVGLHRGVIRKESDAFAGDDSRAFVLGVPDAVSVLLVHGADRPADTVGGRGGWRYLAQALAPGNGPSPFRVRPVAGADLTTGAMSASDLLVFVDPEPLGRRALEGLLAWLDQGGAALFLVGDPTGAGYLSRTLLPGLGLPPAVDFQAVTGAGQHVRVIDATHPVFAGLDPEAVGTFEEVSWRRWFRLTEGEGTVLLTLTGEDPVLIEGARGEGKFAVLPFNLLPQGNDLAASPMALPFFQRLVSWLAVPGRLSAAVNIDVGQEAVVRPLPSESGSAMEKAENLLVTGPGDGEKAAASLDWQGGVPLLRGGTVARAGFITFLAGSDTLGVVAAGIPAMESTLELQDPHDWGKMMQDLDLDVIGDLSDQAPADFMASLGGRDVAPWLLGCALVLLLGEVWLGRGARMRPGPGPENVS
ncbi:MAG: BatA domain-containing protein [Candidatus Krumholzibacteriota bacterium]